MDRRRSAHCPYHRSRLGYLSLLVARHDDGLRADRFDYVVVGARHFALVTDIDPGAVPDVLQLGLKDRGILV